VLIFVYGDGVSDFNPTFALAAETSVLLVSDYINCIALLFLNKIMYICMHVCPSA